MGTRGNRVGEGSTVRWEGVGTADTETWGSRDRRVGDGAAWGGDMVTAMVGCAALSAREGPKGRVPVGVPVCPLVWAGEPCLFFGEGWQGWAAAWENSGGVSLPYSSRCRGGWLL